MGDSNGVVVMLLRYERLPEFCFGCGFIGHSLRECVNELNTVAMHNCEQVRFGAWLHATSQPKVTCSHHSREAPEASTRRRPDVPHKPGDNAVHGSPSCHTAGGTVVGVVSDVGSLETAQHVACRPKLRTIEGQCVGGGVNSAGSGILTRADSGPIQSRLGAYRPVAPSLDLRVAGNGKLGRGCR
ncbi:hypothetical protein ACOSP7_012747 [Xanthoceras sorbifolium]